MTGQAHWDKVYRARDTDALTWHQAAPGLALDLIRYHVPPGPGSAVLDVGGGSSGLAGALTKAGYGPVSVLDLSPEAIERARERLGPEVAAQISWIAADITQWVPDRTCFLWHDRAVFHFLTDGQDRQAYADALLAALRPGGLAMISTFADDGPEKCSGLPVCRYAPAELATEIRQLTGGQLAPIHAERLDHVTPLGNIQKFQISLFRRAD